VARQSPGGLAAPRLPVGCSHGGGANASMQPLDRMDAAWAA